MAIYVKYLDILVSGYIYKCQVQEWCAYVTYMLVQYNEVNTFTTEHIYGKYLRVMCGID